MTLHDKFTFKIGSFPGTVTAVHVPGADAWSITGERGAATDWKPGEEEILGYIASGTWHTVAPIAPVLPEDVFEMTVDDQTEPRYRVSKEEENYKVTWRDAEGFQSVSYTHARVDSFIANGTWLVHPLAAAEPVTDAVSEYDGIKVGDMVRIVVRECCYNFYTGFAEKYDIPNWVARVLPATEAIGSIVLIAPHSTEGDAYLYLYAVDIEGDVFIMGRRGFELTDAPIIHVEMQRALEAAEREDLQEQLVVAAQDVCDASARMKAIMAKLQAI